MNARIDVAGTYEAGTDLVMSSYYAEMSSLTMTRLARLYMVTGGEGHSDEYWAERRQNRAGRTLDSFIAKGAPSNEMSMISDIMYRIVMLRLMESEHILMKRSGYDEAALENAFGPQVAALGNPVNLLFRQLRDTINERIDNELSDGRTNAGFLTLANIFVAVLLSLFCILWLFVAGRKNASPEHPPYLSLRIKNSAIASKLIISFALIIGIFVSHVVVTSYFNRRIETLSQSSSFITARTRALLSFHQEFTEFRRILRASFLNSQWLANTNDVVWRSFEEGLNSSHGRLHDLADAYRESVSRDRFVPPVTDDFRIAIMREVLDYIDNVYEIYSQNFFLTGNGSHEDSSVLDYTAATETLLQILLQYVERNQDMVDADIRDYIKTTSLITIVALVITILMALALAYLMIKSFTDKIRDIGARAALIEKGDFGTGMEGGGDEISRAFSGMVGVFTSLVGEINKVTAENKEGNFDVRINAAGFNGGYNEAAEAVNSLLDAVSAQHEKNERMLFMFENMPLMSVFLDGDRRVIECNRETVRKFKVADKAAFIDNFDSFSPEYQPNGRRSTEYSAECIRRCLDEGNIKFEWTHIDSNGVSLPVEVVGVTEVFRDEKVFVAYLRDVTELKASQKEAEEAAKRVREQAHLYWSVLDAITMPISVTNLDMKWIFVNKATELELNSTRDQLIGKSCFNWGAEICRTPNCGIECHRRGLDKTGYSQNGKDFSVDVTAIKNDDGETIGYIEVVRDITEVRKNMESLKKQANWYWSILDAIPLPISVTDKDRNWTFMNRATELELNDTRANLIGKPCSNWGTSLCKTDECGIECLKNGRYSTNYTQNGKDFSLDVATLEDGNGEHMGYIEIARDITELNNSMRKVMEQQEKTQIAMENSQAKSKFLASMSHEIRTPINAVLGISEIQLQNTGLPLEVEEAFAKIYDSGRILLLIINDILDISKIEAGKMELIVGKYEVASLVTDTVQMHMTYLGSKKIKFSANIDEGIPAHLIGDDLRIKQIINNILSNAFKYTDSGAVTLNMNCGFVDGDDSDGAEAILEIEVADTGKGMTETQLLALTDEYTRFHEKESRFTQGTGLGMSIVYNLISLMGGTIDVKSEVGVGTTVMLHIPQKISGTAKVGREAAENMRRLDSGVLSGAKKFNFTPEPMPYGSVLVVDDVEANLYVAKGLLNFYDLKIETVTGGRAALEKIREGKVYDIIFMDHMMPDMNGVEATMAIRELGYAEPIVALTANALIGQAEEFMKNGFDGFLSKPIQTVQLNTTLTKFIRDKQPPEVLAAIKTAAAESATDDDAANANQEKSKDMDDFLNSSEVYQEAYKDFVRSQKNVIKDMSDALDSGDLETAHRLAHTLKGLAAMVGENSLVLLARAAEDTLRSGSVPTEMDELAREFESVMGKIETHLAAAPAPRNAAPERNLDKAATKELFDKAAELLAAKRGSVVKLADGLAAVPGTEALIEHIEDLEFETALEKLDELRKTLEV
ncbi:MAG: response regulator [Treponema sp.]|nr:response regulator [Treponema sp.]